MRRGRTAESPRPALRPCSAGCTGGRVIRAGPSEVCLHCGGTGTEFVSPLYERRAAADGDSGRPAGGV